MGRQSAAQETRMSNVAPAASISSQPPVPYTPPVDNRAQADAKAAEKSAAKTAELTKTAVAAQAVKETGRGRVLDIQV